MTSKNQKSLLKLIALSAAAGVAMTAVASSGVHFGVALALGMLFAAVLFCAMELARLHVRWPAQRAQLKHAGYEAASAGASPWFERTLKPRLPLPSLSGWALEPETAGYLVRVVRAERPQLVLELGSGVSTLLVAYALEQNGRGRIRSFEADEEFARRTRQLLRLHGLEHHAEVSHAPLERLEIDGWSGLWYDTRAFAGVAEASADLLIVDGPPRRTCSQARYPALPVLGSKLHPDAAIIIDDAYRSAERETVDRWQADGMARLETLLRIGTGVAAMRASMTEG